MSGDLTESESRKPHGGSSAAKFAEVARSLSGEPTVTKTLQRIVELAVETIDGCDAAGLLLVSNGEINDLEIVTPGPAHPHYVPRVDDRYVSRAQNNLSHFRYAVSANHRLVALMQNRRDKEGIGLPASTAKAPLAIQAITVSGSLQPSRRLDTSGNNRSN